MAVLKGIKEKVHLPLYDSLFVRPTRQLRESEGSSVFKFFVNVQAKTKLETNMQSASLLPHWNTFEARALRVVVSDLPPKFPGDVEKCLSAPSQACDGCGAALARCCDDLSALTASEKAEPVNPPVSVFQKRVSAFIEAVKNGSEIPPDLDECLHLLRTFYDPGKMGRLLRLHIDLKAIRTDLTEVIRRTRVRVGKRTEVDQFADNLAALDDDTEEQEQLRRLKEVDDCLDTFGRLVNLVNHIREIEEEDPPASVPVTDPLAPVLPSRSESLARMKADLLEVRAALDLVSISPVQGSEDDIRKCLDESLSDKRRIPLDEQLFGNSAQIFAKLIFNSVTSLFVGEKVMIQMPTWFFPAGGGPYSGNGRVTSHGFPGPEATFRFAEPVSIVAQQNFRVEMEIPDASVLGELQRIYGPFFIWVALDGYMRRDVQ
jgi:hypothetical protein